MAYDYIVNIGANVDEITPDIIAAVKKADGSKIRIKCEDKDIKRVLAQLAQIDAKTAEKITLDINGDNVTKTLTQIRNDALKRIEEIKQELESLNVDSLNSDLIKHKEKLNIKKNELNQKNRNELKNIINSYKNLDPASNSYAADKQKLANYVATYKAAGGEMSEISERIQNSIKGISGEVKSISVFPSLEKEVLSLENIITETENKINRYNALQKELTDYTPFLSGSGSGSGQGFGIGEGSFNIEDLEALKAALENIKQSLATVAQAFGQLDEAGKLQTLISSINGINTALSSIKTIFIDVGDGQEFSPLLKTISEITSAIGEMKQAIEKNKLNINLELGHIDEKALMNVEGKKQDLLRAYQERFSAMKNYNAGDKRVISSMMNKGRFRNGNITSAQFGNSKELELLNKSILEFDESIYDNIDQKIKAYESMIQRMIDASKLMYGENIYDQMDSKYKRKVSSAKGNLTKASNVVNKNAMDEIGQLFGSPNINAENITGDISGIIHKLDEMVIVFQRVMGIKFDINTETVNSEFVSLLDVLNQIAEAIKGINGNTIKPKIEGKIAEGETHADNPKDAQKGKGKEPKKKDSSMSEADLEKRTSAIKDTIKNIQNTSQETENIITGITEFYDSQGNLVKAQVKQRQNLEDQIKTITTTINYDKKNGISYSSDIESMDFESIRKQNTRESIASYQEEIKLLNQINKLKIKNISADDPTKVFNNELISSLEKQIQDVQTKRAQNGLETSESNNLILKEQKQLTEELTTAQNAYNAKLSEQSKIQNENNKQKAEDNSKYNNLDYKNLKQALSGVSIGNAIFSDVKTDSSGKTIITFIEQIGNASEITTVKVNDLQEALNRIDASNKQFNNNGLETKYSNKSVKTTSNSEKKDTTIQTKTSNDIENAINRTKTIIGQLKATGIGQEFEDSFSHGISEIEKLNQSLKSGDIELEEYKIKVKNIKDALSGNFTNSIINDIKKLNNSLKSGIKSDIGMEQFTNLFDDVIKKYNELRSLSEKGLITPKSLNSVNDFFQAFQLDLNKSLKPFDNVQGKPQEYIAQLAQAKAQLSSVQAIMNKVQNGEIVTDEDIANIKIYINQLRGLQESTDKIANASKVSHMLGEIAEVLNENTAMSKSLRMEFEQLQAEMKAFNGVIPEEEFKQFGHRLEALKTQLKESNKTGLSFFDGVAKKARTMSQNFIAMYFSLYDIIRYIRTGITYIRELDTAFTEMRKVSDESTRSLKNFQKESFNIANAVGTTAVQIQNSTADWLRLGESFEEAKKSAEVSNILKNVSEFESIDDATESLVAMSAAYDELDKIEIVDKLNNIGNNYAIATDGLATALQASASALRTAGNDIDESIALVTAGNQVVQDPDKVGAGIRTIALRITGTEAAKAELEEMGEDVEDFVIQTSAKSQQTIKDFTRVASNNFKGFDILDDNGNFKSTFEILLGISKIYAEIVETDKKYGSNMANGLLEALAGKNRSNIAASILQNPEILESVYESSQGSVGSAQQELEKYLDSIDGKIQQFTNRFQEFWYTLVDSEVIKGIIDIGTTALNIINKVIDGLGEVGTLIAVVSGGIGIKNLFNISKGKDPISLFGGGRDKELSLCK